MFIIFSLNLFGTFPYCFLMRVISTRLGTEVSCFMHTCMYSYYHVSPEQYF